MNIYGYYRQILRIRMLSDSMIYYLSIIFKMVLRDKKIEHVIRESLASLFRYFYEFYLEKYTN